MEINIKRYYSDDNCTAGIILINGSYQCATLEDEYREVKIKGKTRIPAGRYKIELRTEGSMHQNYKSRFKEFHNGMLHLIDVPNFKYIYIHIGNTDADTSGCILVGEYLISNNGKLKLVNSTIAYKKIYQIILESLKKEEVYINIIDKDK